MHSSVVPVLVCALTVTASPACRDDGIGIPPKVCSTTAVAAHESPLMEPGGDCIGCHSADDGPRFAVAGTVMNALHDDTNCAGVGGVTVRLKGADGQTIEMLTNENGNFYMDRLASALVFPYTAEVSRGGVTVPMLTPRSATETDCASCHTAAGANAAPGRIVAP